MSAYFDLDDDCINDGVVVVTRQVRRETRRWKAQKKKPNQNLTENQKAKIQSTGKKRREEKELTRKERVLGLLSQLATPTLYDASLITNHVATLKRAEISGETLEELYARLASTVLLDDTEDGVHRAKIAVTFACCSEWLIRTEPSGYTIRKLYQQESVRKLVAA